MDAYAPEVERMMRRLFDSLRENDRRRYAAIEAAKLGHGGIEYIAGVLGCDPKTIQLGLGNWQERTTSTRVAREKKGWAETVDRFRPDSRGDFPQGARGPHRG